MKKIIIIISFLLLLCSCSSYTEINDLAFLTGLAIDYKDDMYNIYSELIINDKESFVKIVNTKSSSIDEALKEVSKYVNKELFISDIKVLFITDNVIKSNVNYEDFFLRSNNSKMSFNVYIIDEKDIENIFNTSSDIESSSLYVDKMLDFNNKVFSTSTPLDFTDLMITKLDYGINAVYPTIAIKNDSLYLDNLVSYNYNKEKIILDEVNSSLYNIITNNTITTSIDIPCEDNSFTIELNNTNTKYEFNNNTFYINISASSTIKNYTCSYKLNNTNTLSKIEKLSNKYFKDKINELIKLSKENNNDFIGFGSYIYKHNRKYFDFENNNWDEYINDLNIVVKTNIKIESIGEARKVTYEK